MNLEKLHAVAAEEAAKATGNYIIPTKDFERLLQTVLCELNGLKPVDPTVSSPYGSNFVGEKSVRIAAEKNRFPDELVCFFRAELEVQIRMHRGVTQLEIACHNTRDNAVNVWGDSIFLGFRLR